MSAPLLDTFDLVVVGSGAAGLMAALAGLDQGMRILVVEDERKIGSFLQRGLEDEGHRVDLVTDLAAARVAL